MNIHWKAKSFASSVIDAFSLEKTLHFLQRNVTKKGRIDISNPLKRRSWLAHVDNLATLVRPKVFEFEAGQHLAQNIFLSKYVEFQAVVDLFRMLNIHMSDDLARKLAQRLPACDRKWDERRDG